MRVELKMIKEKEPKSMHMVLEDCEVTITQGIDEIEPYKGWKRVRSNRKIEVNIRGTRPDLAHKEQNRNQTNGKTND